MDEYDVVERELRALQSELTALIVDERTIPRGRFQGLAWGDFVRAFLHCFFNHQGELATWKENLCGLDIGEVFRIGQYVRWTRRHQAPRGLLCTILQKTSRAEQLYSRCAALRRLQPALEDKRVKKLRRSTTRESPVSYTHLRAHET